MTPRSTTATPPTPVVRASAIERAHADLGVRWTSETERFPDGYGAADPAAERAAVDAGAGLAEIGPLDEWLLRGPGALAATAGIARGRVAVVVGRLADVDVAGGGAVAWVLGPDEVLLVAPAGALADATVTAELESGDASVIEMTGARSSMRLVGPAASAILAELCVVDTTPAALAPAGLLQVSIAGVRAFIARLDALGHPGYTIMVARDEAAYIWDAITAIGAAHLLTAVGPRAIPPDAIEPEASR